MEEVLIAPCGMNCGFCSSYLAMKNDLKSTGNHEDVLRRLPPAG